MTYTRFTTDWNADPNAPQVQLSVDGSSLTVEFYLNHFLFDKFKEGDKARLTFNQCYKYALTGLNDEAYFHGRHRYINSELPWGEFYQIKTNWETDFPVVCKVLFINNEEQQLNHYIFFFKDSTLECIAEYFTIEFDSQRMSMMSSQRMF